MRRNEFRSLTESGIPDKAAEQGLEAVPDRLDIQLNWRCNRRILERTARSTYCPEGEFGRVIIQGAPLKNPVTLMWRFCDTEIG